MIKTIISQEQAEEINAAILQAYYDSDLEPDYCVAINLACDVVKDFVVDVDRAAKVAQVVKEHESKGK